MTIGEAVRFTRSFYPHWNGELLDQILDHFALPRRAKIRRLSQRPAGAGLAGAGRGARSGTADSRRSDARPRHGRAPRFPRIADSDHSARRADDPDQLAHPGRRRARGRPDRHPGRRRAAGRLPDRLLQDVAPQGRARIRRRAAARFPPATAWSAPGASATGWRSCSSATARGTSSSSSRSSRVASKCWS